MQVNHWCVKQYPVFWKKCDFIERYQILAVWIFNQSGENGRLLNFVEALFGWGTVVIW